ncbi:MAG TPA: response regulator [Pirellulales bacterium]|jgi:DNA-binding response OmpR family regulator|nr:response regulator [Pirellulales bacterium]
MHNPALLRRALVVDDSPTQAMDLRQRLVRGGFQVTVVPNGNEALKAVERQPPDVVLTDLVMPEMDGLELVRRLRGNHPGLPIILMTAAGSEETTVTALRIGAAGYVAKKNLGRDLFRTLENVLVHSRAATAAERAARHLTRTRSRFVLGNDCALLSPLIGRLQNNLSRFHLFDETEQTQIGMALREAVANAMEHGNLEANSQLREDDETVYHRLLDERRRESPYRERRVFVVAEESRGGVWYSIRDEGPGFNPALLPDPTDPANLERVSGRGLLLIHAFMDEVRHNSTGNEITMVKRVAVLNEA